MRGGGAEAEAMAVLEFELNGCGGECRRIAYPN